MNHRSNRGVIDGGLILVAAGALAVGVVAGGWKPTEWFRKKPPTAEVTQLQAKLDDAERRAKELEAQAEAAKAAERAKQEQEVRYAQEMVVGAGNAIKRQPAEHRTPETQLTSDLLNRAEFALGLAIGDLPVAQRAEIIRIVDGALSKVQTERDAARIALEAKDAELRVAARERDELKAEIPKIEAKVAKAEQEAAEVKKKVDAKVEDLKVAAKELDAEKRKAGSLAAQFDKLWRIGLWCVVGYLFITIGLPGIVKHLESGRLKNALRAASGYLTNPLLHLDAAKKIDQLKRQIEELNSKKP